MKNRKREKQDQSFFLYDDYLQDKSVSEIARRDISTQK